LTGFPKVLKPSTSSPPQRKALKNNGMIVQMLH